MGKQQPPADDKEVLRQLTREAHEAVRDLRVLLREIRQAKAQLPATADKLIEDAINTHMEAVQAILNGAIGTVQRVIENEEARTRNHYGDLLGRGGADLILHTCAMVLHLAVPSITVEGWMQQIAENRADHNRDGCSCLGCVTVRAASPAAPRVGPTPVIQVVTKDQLASIKDPGLIIDMTSGSPENQAYRALKRSLRTRYLQRILCVSAIKSPGRLSRWERVRHCGEPLILIREAL